MSTVTTWQTKSTSSEATEQLGLQLGKALKGGEVIELVSDLGGGKTTFVRGLARGAGSDDKVASPSFTISRLYQTPRFEIHHFDLYRLGEPGLMTEAIAEVIQDPKAVVVIEWADSVYHVLPDKRFTVQFSYTATGDRNIKYSSPEELSYLLPTHEPGSEPELREQ